MKRLDIDLGSTLGPVTLRTPIIAASGTVGSVVDFAGAADFRFYGAAVAKSVSSEPWPGRPAPRLGSAGVGMLNGIGIQNPGVAAWIEEVGPRIETVPVPIWGSAVGHDAGGFAEISTMSTALGESFAPMGRPVTDRTARTTPADATGSRAKR